MSERDRRSQWMLEIIVPGPPVGKARPRVWLGRVRMPENHRAWELKCRTVAEIEWRRKPQIDSCVELHVIQVCARPQSMRRKKDPLGRILNHLSKPDIDNCAGLVMDALTKAGIWVDDTRVARLYAEKWYAAKDERPCVEIKLRKAELPRREDG